MAFHLGAILQEVLMNLIRHIYLMIILSKLLPHLPGAKELIREKSLSANTFSYVEYILP